MGSCLILHSYPLLGFLYKLHSNTVSRLGHISLLALREVGLARTFKPISAIKALFHSDCDERDHHRGQKPHSRSDQDS